MLKVHWGIHVSYTSGLDSVQEDRVWNTDGQRERWKVLCILIRKATATQTFAVSVINSNHGK